MRYSFFRSCFEFNVLIASWFAPACHSNFSTQPLSQICSNQAKEKAKFHTFFFCDNKRFDSSPSLHKKALKWCQAQETNPPTNTTKSLLTQVSYFLLSPDVKALTTRTPPFPTKKDHREPSPRPPPTATASVGLCLPINQDQPPAPLANSLVVFQTFKARRFQNYV